MLQDPGRSSNAEKDPGSDPFADLWVLPEEAGGTGDHPDLDTQWQPPGGACTMVTGAGKSHFEVLHLVHHYWDSPPTTSLWWKKYQDTYLPVEHSYQDPPKVSQMGTEPQPPASRLP